MVRGPGSPNFPAAPTHLQEGVGQTGQGHCTGGGGGLPLWSEQLSSFPEQVWTWLRGRRSLCGLHVTWKVTVTGAPLWPCPEPRGPGPDARVHLLTAGPQEADSAVTPIPRARKPSPSPFRVPPERLR